MATRPGTANDLVTHNLLGKTRPVRVRIVPADHEAMLAREQTHGLMNHDGVRLFRLERALARVLNPRYVAEVGLVPGTADGPNEARRYAVTLRRYVGKRLDPTAVFTVRGDSDDAPLAGWLDLLSMPQRIDGAREERRVTITLPEKALRRCAKPKRAPKPTTQTASEAAVSDTIMSHGN